MEMMEKVERLREKANVSYEEAKDALEQANGDLLDAIVLLERQGKVKGPAQSTFSTDYEEQTEFVKVRDKVEEQENSAPSFGRTFGRLFRGFIGRLYQKYDIYRDKGRRRIIYDAHDLLRPSAVLLLGDTRSRHGHCPVLRDQVLI